MPLNPLTSISRHESGFRNVYQGVVPAGGGFNPSTGTITGPSTASGYFQITNTTWGGYKGYPTAMSAPFSVQEQRAAELYNTRGFRDWAPYNANLRREIAENGIDAYTPRGQYTPVGDFDAFRNGGTGQPFSMESSRFTDADFGAYNNAGLADNAPSEFSPDSFDRYGGSSQWSPNMGGDGNPSSDFGTGFSGVNPGKGSRFADFGAGTQIPSDMGDNPMVLHVTPSGAEDYKLTDADFMGARNDADPWTPGDTTSGEQPWSQLGQGQGDEQGEQAQGSQTVPQAIDKQTTNLTKQQAEDTKALTKQLGENTKAEVQSEQGIAKSYLGKADEYLSNAKDYFTRAVFIFTGLVIVAAALYFFGRPAQRIVVNALPKGMVPT